MSTHTPCPMCGAETPPDATCSEVFDIILAKEYSEYGFAAVHLYSVDSYALQHSEDHSPRSNAYHLMRLSRLIVDGASPHIVKGATNNKSKAFEKAYQQFPFLEPPPNRGDLTVMHLHNIDDVPTYQQRAREWAESVWEAWEIHHPWAIEASNRIPSKR